MIEKFCLVPPNAAIDGVENDPHIYFGNNFEENDPHIYFGKILKENYNNAIAFSDIT